MRKIIASFTVSMAVFASGCGVEKNSCAPYARISGDKKKVEKLLSWVNRLALEKDGSLERVSRSKINDPGEFAIHNSLDLRKLGFPPDSEVRVIMGSNRKPVAFFFGHRTMHGVIISVVNRGDTIERFGMVTSNLHVVSDRVAYVCYQRD